MIFINYKAQTSRELTFIINTLMELISKGDYQFISNYLHGCSVSDMTSAVCITIIRTLYPFKEKIPPWLSFVYRVRDKLDTEGKGSKKVLRGIDY